MKLVSGSLEGFNMQADIGDERYLSQQEYITIFCLLRWSQRVVAEIFLESKLRLLN